MDKLSKWKQVWLVVLAFAVLALVGYVMKTSNGAVPVPDHGDEAEHQH